MYRSVPACDRHPISDEVIQDLLNRQDKPPNDQAELTEFDSIQDAIPPERESLDTLLARLQDQLAENLYSLLAASSAPGTALSLVRDLDDAFYFAVHSEQVWDDELQTEAKFPESTRVLLIAAHQKQAARTLDEKPDADVLVVRKPLPWQQCERAFKNGFLN